MAVQRSDGFTNKQLKVYIGGTRLDADLIVSRNGTQIALLNEAGFYPTYGYKDNSLAKTASYTIAYTDSFVSFSGSLTATGSNIITGTLPPVADAVGRNYLVAKTDNVTASFINVIPSGSDVIVGAQNNKYELWMSGSTLGLFSNGTNWYVSSYVSGTLGVRI